MPSIIPPPPGDALAGRYIYWSPCQCHRGNGIQKVRWPLLILANRGNIRLPRCGLVLLDKFRHSPLFRVLYSQSNVCAVCRPAIPRTSWERQQFPSCQGMLRTVCGAALLDASPASRGCVPPTSCICDLHRGCVPPTPCICALHRDCTLHRGCALHHGCVPYLCAPYTVHLRRSALLWNGYIVFFQQNIEHLPAGIGVWGIKQL